MQRHPQLQSLSREHHAALRLAKACQQAAQAGQPEVIGLTCSRALLTLKNELSPHFQIEESLWLPLLIKTEEQHYAHQTIRDHRHLCTLREGLQHNEASVLAEFGRCLMEHVRFEERKLFPRLENYLSF